MDADTKGGMHVADIILDALEVKKKGSRSRIYCLGANEGRISFASQQVRALNLVWALGLRKKISTSSITAVVGAGVSGLTAAAALRAQGASVRVYESAGRALHRQSYTTHRQVHPTVNWWPSEDSLDPTTDLPYFNWHSDQCNRVMEVIGTDFAKLMRESGSSLRTEFDNEIKGLVCDESNEGRVTLLTDGDDLRGFDLVIVATGFGEETKDPVSSWPSYWAAEQLESLLVAPNPKKQVFISGSGDGGLIDALRLAYDFRFGELSFRVAEALVGTDIARRVADIEARDGLDDWVGVCLGYEDIAKDIHNAVAGSASDICYLNARSILEAHVSNKQGRVTIVDPNKSSPYEGRAAPIHKLMVAYARHRALLSFERYTLAAQDGELLLQVSEGEKLRVKKKLPREQVEVVVRHGAPRHRDEVLEPEEWAQVSASQRMMSAYSYKRAWSEHDAVPVPAGWSCRVNSPGQFMNSLKSQAISVFHQMKSNAKVGIEASGFIVVGHDKDFKPPKLFGMPVKYITPDQVDTGDALF